MFIDIVLKTPIGRHVRELAIRAERMARELNQMPPGVQEKENRDTVAILHATCEILTALLEQGMISVNANEHLESTTESASLKDIEKTDVIAVDDVPQHVMPIAPIEPSETAQALMKVCDWVLWAASGRVPVQPEVLDEIHRQLTVALAREDVTELRAEGLCDYERQQVVDVRHTDDAALADHVCSTVRPGYIFHKRLLRPQEVIVYVDR